VLLGDGHEHLPYYLRDCPAPDALAAYLARRSATLEQICRKTVSFEQVADALATALLER
jgi:hypothetical protein